MKGDTEQEIADKRCIGNRLRVLREKRGLSQKKLAEMMGERYNRKLIAQYESGGDHMRMGTLFTACEALGVSLNALVPARLLSDADELLAAFYELTPENRYAAVHYVNYLLIEQKKG